MGLLEAVVIGAVLAVGNVAVLLVTGAGET
jgi:hypothetical protein